MEKTSYPSIPGTLFSNCMAKHGEKTDDITWLYDIKNGTYRTEVEEFRRLEESGQTELAAEKKRMLPAIVPAGYMPEGRTESDPIELSYVIMIDYDNHNQKWSAAACKKVQNELGLVGAYRTLRNGLRLFVRLPAFTRDDYGFFARVVFEYFDKLVGYPHDPQVNTASHLCSASYDPDAWIVSPENYTEFPAMKILEQIQHDAYQLADGKLTVPDVGTDEPTLEEEVAASYNAAQANLRDEFSKNKMDDILTRFLGRCPLVKGSRNNNLVRFGQYLHFMRCNVNELEYFINASTHLINDREYNLKRVRQCICWGYMHNDRQLEISGNAKHITQDHLDEFEGRNVHKVQKVHYNGCFSDEVSEYTDFQNSFYQTVKEDCPFIPDFVYEHIPSFFKPLILETGNPRDKMTTFFGALAAVSAAMPNVTVQVRQKNYSTNAYFCVIGPAGSGKGMLTLAPTLLDEIQRRMELENDRMRAEYERKESAWQLENKLATKELREPNLELKPKELLSEYTLKTESQTSRSKLIADLAFNHDGLFMFAPELNTINESLHSDCGHHSAELAGIAMNETQGYSYKSSPKVTVKFPKLTILATGTPSQYVSFIGNTHAGMESRVHTLLVASNYEWISWGDENEGSITDIEQAYKDASVQLADIFDYLKKFPTHVTIPAEYRYKCDNYCRFFLGRLVDEEHGNLDSIVKRCPILIARLCGIFCALRKYEMGFPGVEMQATEQDVETALKITITLLRHSCTATSMLVEDGKKVNKLQSVFKRDKVFHVLADTFTTQEMTNYCVKNLQFSASSIRRTLMDWESQGYIERVKRGFYHKTGKEMP